MFNTNTLERFVSILDFDGCLELVRTSIDSYDNKPLSYAQRDLLKQALSQPVGSSEFFTYQLENRYIMQACFCSAIIRPNARLAIANLLAAANDCNLLTPSTQLAIRATSSLRQ